MSEVASTAVGNDDSKINCPFCEHMCDVMKAYKGEDSTARGSVFICLNPDCKKKFYSWVSDGYKYGHAKEYKTSITKLGTMQRAGR